MEAQRTITFAGTFKVIKHPLFNSISRYYRAPGCTNGVAYKQVFIAKCSDKLWRIGLQTIPDEKHRYQLYILTAITITKTQLGNFLAPYTNMNPNSDRFMKQKRIVRFMIEEHAPILEHVETVTKKVRGKEITWDKYILPEVGETLTQDDIAYEADIYANKRNNGKN